MFDWEGADFESIVHCFSWVPPNEAGVGTRKCVLCKCLTFHAAPMSKLILKCSFKKHNSLWAVKLLTVSESVNPLRVP